MGVLKVGEETCQAILVHAERINYAHGAAIFLQGQPCTGAYLIISGTVALSLRCPSGKSVFSRDIETGCLIGLPAAMTSTDYSLTAIASSDVCAAHITAEVLASLMCDPETALDMVHVLSREVRTLREVMSNLTPDAKADSKIV
jgi:CRP-like cAMP-binding protein